MRLRLREIRETLTAQCREQIEKQQDNMFVVASLYATVREIGGLRTEKHADTFVYEHTGMSLQSWIDTLA